MVVIERVKNSGETDEREPEHSGVWAALTGRGVLPGACVLKAARRQRSVSLMCRLGPDGRTVANTGFIFKERWNQSRPAPYQLYEADMCMRRVLVFAESMPVRF